MRGCKKEPLGNLAQPLHPITSASHSLDPDTTKEERFQRFESRTESLISLVCSFIPHTGSVRGLGRQLMGDRGAEGPEMAAQLQSCDLGRTWGRSTMEKTYQRGEQL